MKEVQSLPEKLLEQMEKKSDVLNLSASAPVLEFLPPFLLNEKASSSLQEAQYSFSIIPKSPSVRKGRPVEIHRFLTGMDDMELDFEQLGCVRLSRKIESSEQTDEKVAKWLNYALSPELWGTEGKWPRFHERLVRLFENNNLLEGHPLPGYYPLKSKGRSWDKLPFRGDLAGDVYTLLLPWTFSLTDLKRIESLLNEEP